MIEHFFDIKRWLESLLGVAPVLAALIPLLRQETIRPLEAPYSPVGFGLGWESLIYALCVAIVVLPFFREGESRFKWFLPRAVWLSLACFGVGFLMALVYAFALDYTTVSTPLDQRFQIGFGKLGWSLTAEGLEIRDQFPASSPDKWVEKAALGYPGGTERFWKSWSISIAALLNIVLIATSCSLLSLGWGLLVSEGAVRLESARKKSSASIGIGAAGEADRVESRSEDRVAVDGRGQNTVAADGGEAGKVHGANDVDSPINRDAEEGQERALGSIDKGARLTDDKKTESDSD